MPKTPATSSRKRLVLLDSHAILHRAYHALPDFVSTKGEPTGAIYGLVSMLIAIVAELKPDYVVACYDLPGPTYRHEAYKEYKAGRKKADEELVIQMKRSRDVFTTFNIPIYDKPGFEADDMLGTIVSQVLGSGKSGDFFDIDIVIASGDMDTLQLVSGKRVQVYTLKKGIKDTIMYDEDGVQTRFGFGPKLLPDYKGLRGDPSDNIIGIKGIGEKTASTLIQTFGTIEEMYKVLEKCGKAAKKGVGKKGDDMTAYAPFTDVGITPRVIKLLEEGKEEAEFSKMLATIRHDAPISFVLPERKFVDEMKAGERITAITALFNELNFRTLGARLKQAVQVALGEVSSMKVMTKGNAGAGGDAGSTDSADGMGAPLKLFEDVPREKLIPTSIALWLLDSSINNPGVEDIANFTNMTISGMADFEKATTIIFAELDKRGLRKVYDTIEAPIIPIVDKMCKKGVKIDRKLLGQLSKTYHVELDKLEKKIWEYAGQEFNVNSPKQLGEILFDKLALTAKGLRKTEGGARSTRESELEKLRGAHPIVPLLFEYREFQKLLSTYIDTIPTLLDADDRLHTTFIQAGAATGRMASQNPGLQNIPVKTELGRAIRKAFIADPGFVLGAFDYSQIELRIAAFLSGDEKLISIFKNGEDVHTAVAAEVFGVLSDKVDREMRRRAKVINFGILYGMGVNALRANLNEAASEDEDGGAVSRAEAQVFYNNYFEKFSGLASYLDRVKAEAARKGYTETFFGRRRYFEGITSKIPYVRAMAERMAINAPIQGTNADIVKIAMKRIDDYIEREKLGKDAALILQVHDELVYELRADKAEKIGAEIKKIMESVIDPAETRGVVCVANGKYGVNWGELE